VQRDQFSIDYYLAKRDIGSLVVFLVEASRNYLPEEEILAEIEARIAKIKKKIKAMPEPLQGDSKIYQDIAKNYQDLKRIYTVYLDTRLPISRLAK
jgi:hypothetical protein